MDVMIREDVSFARLFGSRRSLTSRAVQITTDQFVDVVLGNRKYVPCLYWYAAFSIAPLFLQQAHVPRSYNKIDAVSLEEVDRIAREPNTVVISCQADLNLDTLLKRIWQGIGLNRVYTKKRGARPDLSDPLIVKKNATIEQVVCYSLSSVDERQVS